MVNLLEKTYNCYLNYIGYLSKGKVNQDYELLYDAILSLKVGLTEDVFYQYFMNNLNCPIKRPLNVSTDLGRDILWTLDSSDSILSSFSWTSILIPNAADYTLSTNKKYGFNFLYIAVPQGVQFTVRNELDMKLYDSTLSDYLETQLFSLVGTYTDPSGKIKSVYRKDDVFNSNNIVTFKIKIL